MQSAAGGTSQRLNPAVAMILSRSRILVEVPFPVNGLSMVVMRCPLGNFARQRALERATVSARL
jgi:hypothetical protein